MAVKRVGNNDLSFLTPMQVDMIDYAIYLLAIQENLNIEYEIKRREEKKGVKNGKQENDES